MTKTPGATTCLDRWVAVKVLHPMLAADPAMRRRFEAEGRTAARIMHPNVVQVYGSGEDDGVPCLVMEYVEGPTLADEIARGPLHPDRARRIALGVARGLAAAHAQGITHCDVKPASGGQPGAERIRNGVRRGKSTRSSH